MKIGIIGYGNLGKQAEKSVNAQPDMELAAVFSRRHGDLKIETKTARSESLDNILAYKGKIDVMLFCGGSATDLPQQMPMVAPHFCFVDCFDNHGRIPEHFAAADKLLRAGGNVGAISVGWDPGLFSVQRLYGQSVLPQSKTYTFWGKGVSQGHSDAVRRIEGVKYAVQYTVPVENAIERVRKGENPELTAREKHTRHCFVVADKNADTEKIRREIVEMPDYFKDYDTAVNFITEEEFLKSHTAMPHGGFVLSAGTTPDGSKQIIEYSLKLDSNPAFTASVQTAYARAVYRLKKEGATGAKTVFDIAPSYLSLKSSLELYKEIL